MNTAEIRYALENPFFDSGIRKHGFARFIRDYEIVIQIFKSQFLYTFTHCTSAVVTTALADWIWLKSWEDTFLDPRWREVSNPPAYVWATNYTVAYPGAKLIEDSARAREWADRMGKAMHEVKIEAGAYTIELIFHDLRVRELREGDDEWIAGKW